MRDVATIESEQKGRYPGLHVRRDGEAVLVHVPIQFRKRNGRRQIVTPGAQPAKLQPRRDTNETLVEAVAKAYRWQEQIESGQYACLEDLAKSLKLDRSYVGRGPARRGAVRAQWDTSGCARSSSCGRATEQRCAVASASWRINISGWGQRIDAAGVPKRTD